MNSKLESFLDYLIFTTGFLKKLLTKAFKGVIMVFSLIYLVILLSLLYRDTIKNYKEIERNDQERSKRI